MKINDPYFKTSKDLIREKIKLLNLKEGDIVCDLGCGDASALIQACNSALVYSIGYEVLPKAIMDAKNNIIKASLSDRVKIIEKDFYKADLTEVDALILYLSRNVLGQISLKLENELKKGAKIVTHSFDIPAWKADLEKEIILPNGLIEKVYLYTKK